MVTGIVRIEQAGTLLAIVVPADHAMPGSEFLTTARESLQIGIHCHPAGKQITTHTHELNDSIDYKAEYREVIFIRRGLVRTNIFGLDNDQLIQSLVLGPGAAIVLYAGWHSFEVLEDVEMIEMKTVSFGMVTVRRESVNVK